jgi:hypothetical protein
MKIGRGIAVAGRQSLSLSLVSDQDRGVDVDPVALSIGAGTNIASFR